MARSCSCGIALSTVATSPGALIAAATATAALTGLRFCGMRRRAAGVRRRLVGFADFRLREKREVAADLAERSGGDAERAGERDNAIAMRVPGQRGHLEVQTFPERARQIRAAVTEARRACRTHRRTAARGVASSAC